MRKIQVLWLLLIAICGASYTQAQLPYAHYRFEDDTDLEHDDSGNGYDLSTANFHWGHVWQSDRSPTMAVDQGALELPLLNPNNPNTNNILRIKTPPTGMPPEFNSPNSFTIEFMARWSSDCYNPRLLALPDKLEFGVGQTGMQLNLWVDEPTQANQKYTLLVPFTGFLNTRRNHCYYLDNQWHHFAIVYDNTATNQELRLYVDGISPCDFAEPIEPFSTPVVGVLPVFSPLGNASAFAGGFDEIAFYEDPLPENTIWQHFIDVTVDGVPYTDCDLTGTCNTPPPPELIPDQAYHPLDFPPNYWDPVTGEPTTVGVPLGLDQIKSYAIPRYMPDHQLNENFPWMNLPQLVSDQPDVINPPVPTTVLQNEVAQTLNLQNELIDNWHYMVMLGNANRGRPDVIDPNNPIEQLNEAWIGLANQRPTVPRALISHWGQLNHNHPPGPPVTAQPFITRQDLPDDHYVRDGTEPGDPFVLNLRGRKQFSPASDVAHGGVFDASVQDGAVTDWYLGNYKAALTDGRIDFMSENGEVPPAIFSEQELLEDPIIPGDMGANNWIDYQALKKQEVRSTYRDAMTNLGTTNFSWYSMSGSHFSTMGQHRYDIMREINTVMDNEISPQSEGKRYPTPYFYPQGQAHWYNSTGSITGFGALIEGRLNELPLGDSLYAPYVSPGFSDARSSQYTLRDHHTMRPGAYLGMLKAISATGAEYFHNFMYAVPLLDTIPDTTFCIIPDPCGGPPLGVDKTCWTAIGELIISVPQDPRWFAWKTAMPSYAQAITSRYEDLLNHGVLLDGNRTQFTGPANAPPQYSFWAGFKNLVVARGRHNNDGTGIDQFMITGSVQPPTSTVRADNLVGSAPLEGTASFDFVTNTRLTIDVRRQGSTYILEYNHANPENSIFYQLDKWHQWEHPSHWSTNFSFEAEVHDGVTQPGTEALEIATENILVNGQEVDFTASTSYLTIPGAAGQCWDLTNAGPSAEYRFHPRNTTDQAELFMWVRARTKDGTPSGLYATVDGIQPKFIPCINSTDWAWYYFGLDATDETYGGISFDGAATTMAEHILHLQPTNAALEIEQVVLSTSAQLDPDIIAESPGIAYDLSNHQCVFPTVDFESTTVCAGSPTTFTQLASNAPCAVYEWDFDGEGTATGEIVTHTFQNPGTYWVTLDVCLGPGMCFGYSEAVTVLPGPTITWTLPQHTFCSDPNAGCYTMQAQPTMPGVGTYSATGDLALAISGSDLCIGNIPIASYPLTEELIYTYNEGGCISEVRHWVKGFEQPTIDAGPDQTINCGNAILTATVTPPGTYIAWTETGQNTVLATGTTVSLPVTGTMSFTATAYNGACEASDDVVVTSTGNTTIAIDPGDKTVCQGSCFFEKVAEDPCYTSYSWDLSGIGIISTDPWVCWEEAEGVYDLTVTVVDGCTGCILTGSCVITIVPPNTPSCSLEVACCQAGGGGARGKADMDPFASLQLLQPQVELYPNPFAHTTMLSLTVPRTTNVEVKLLTLDGQLAGPVFKGEATAGVQLKLELGDARLAAGIYQVQVSGPDFTTTKKLVKLK